MPVSYIATIFVSYAIFAIACLGLDTIVGYAGEPMLGFTVIMAVGSYTFGSLIQSFSLPTPIAALVAVLVSAIIGTVIGLSSLLVSEDFLAIVTIGVNFLARAVFQYTPFFGGAYGVILAGGPQSNYAFVVFVLVALLTAFYGHWRLGESWCGLAWKSMREDSLASSSLTVHVSYFKLLSFFLGSIFGGVSGVLYIMFTGAIDPTTFTFVQSIALLAMVIVGGSATTLGVGLGSAVLVILPLTLAILGGYSLLIYGALIVIFMKYQPAGILGRGSYARRVLKLG